ncbi:MAG: 4Fe-4S double cluster binding domain-containing protein, partial [Eubacteriales bacterium]
IECNTAVTDVSYCEDCGACVAACPGTLSGRGDCVSHITQKKGDLTEEEINIIRKYGCAWGCDICQEVCPHTKRAKSSGTIYTKNEWFTKDVILTPSEESLDNDEDFNNRAYSWRGKTTILRNINIIKKI